MTGFYSVNDGTTGPYLTTSSISISNSFNASVGYGPQDPEDKQSKPHPELIFTFVKSKMTKTQQKNLLYRIDRLRHVMNTCLETGQKALADEMLLELAGVLSIQACAASGYDTTIMRGDILKYLGHDSKVSFDTLDKFPRPIPPNIRKIISKVKSSGLFRELWVLYHNPDKTELKSTLDKIVAKDPILFGKGILEDRFFYITDWMDEACDLTLDGLIKHLKLADPSYSPGSIEPLTSEESIAIVERAQAKLDSVKNTGMKTWKTDATVEYLSAAKLSLSERWKIFMLLLFGGKK